MNQVNVNQIPIKQHIANNLINNIPNELKTLKQWVVYKANKVPYKAGDPRYTANSTEPKTWGTFEQSLKSYLNNEQILGIGFVFSENDPYCGIDIDHCISNGRCDHESLEIIKAMGSYTEYSPSGTGVHIICKGKKDDFMTTCKKKSKSNPHVLYEMYDKQRYFTFTGNIVKETYSTIVDRSNECVEFYNQFMADDSEPVTNNIIKLHSFNLEKVLAKDEIFNQLWNGNRPSGDESSDDLALLNKLAYYCNYNEELMVKHFMESPHVAGKDDAHLKKLNRKDYLKRSIDKIMSTMPKRPVGRPREKEVIKPTYTNSNYPVVNEKGKPMKDWTNIEHLLLQQNLEVKFNQISKKVDFTGFEVNVKNMDGVVMEVHSLLNKDGIPMATDFIGKSLNHIANKTNHNPVADYLTTVKDQWDGKLGRIQQICDTLVHADDFDKDLKDLLITKWLLNMATIPFNTGHLNCDGLLVVQGKQGIGKTRWIENLIPTSLIEYLKTGLDVDPRDKDSIMKCINYWIVELGELDSTLKAEQSKLKAFITEKIDEYRIPYDKDTTKFPRTTGFYGTVNKREFLKDETGSRRYWVVPATSINFELFKDFDLDQLWGEVMTLTERGWVHYLTDEEKVRLAIANGQYEIENLVQSKVKTSFAWEAPKELWKPVSQAKIMEVLNLKTSDGLEEAFSKMNVHAKKVRCTYIKRPLKGYVVPPFTMYFGVIPQ